MPRYKFQLAKRSLQATTVVAEMTVAVDIRGRTVFSTIDVVPCIRFLYIPKDHSFTLHEFAYKSHD